MFSSGVSKLEDFSSNSVYDVSTILDSNDNADSGDTENMSTISSVTEAFSKQLTEFKDEIKSLFVQSQQEQKQLISTLVSKVDTLTTFLKQKDDEVEHLNACLESSQERTRFLEGRLCRVEKLLSDVKEDCLQQKVRSMKNNLMFYNIAESSEEGKSGAIRDVLLNVLQSELKMPKEIILSLQIEQIHRVGQKGTRYTRPIVARFSTFEEKVKVVNFIKNLDRSKKISIQIELPPELNKRKKKLWPMFKEARSSGKKVRWLGEKLTIDNKVVEAPKDFVRPLQVDMIENISKIKFRNGTPKLIRDSTFQGHISDVTSVEDIAPSLQVMFMDTRVARATHNTYAYRVLPDGKITEHYEYDGEWDAERRILKILQNKNLVNKLVVVSRWFGGQNLGPKRFEYIEAAAR